MPAHFDRKLAAYQRLALFVEVCLPAAKPALESAAMVCGVGQRVGWRKREEKSHGNKARAKNPKFEFNFRKREL